MEYLKTSGNTEFGDAARTQPADANHAVTQMFNSTVSASALGAAWEIGVLDELLQTGTLEIDDFSGRHDLHGPSVRGIVRALASTGVVVREGSTVHPGPVFDEAYRHRSLFHWLVQGSGELFRNGSYVARNGNRTGDYYQRDSAAISFACREINERFFDPVFWKVMDSFGHEPTKAVDLGSGSGERLIQISKRFPGARGLGIDLESSAIDLASKMVAESGLEESIGFRCGDVLALEPQEEFEDIDLLTCFMMGHDFWPRERCLATLRHLRNIFPNARRFILGDTARTAGVADRDLPIFTLGFEVGHALMGVGLPSLAEWEEVIEESGWRLVQRHTIETPAASAIFELE